MVDRLKLHCERVLEMQIQTDNVFELVQVQIVIEQSVSKMQRSGLIVSQHITELRDKPEMEQLPKQCQKTW